MESEIMVIIVLIYLILIKMIPTEMVSEMPAMNAPKLLPARTAPRIPSMIFKKHAAAIILQKILLWT
jgi:hypothetical protein